MGDSTGDGNPVDGGTDATMKRCLICPRICRKDNPKNTDSYYCWYCHIYFNDL